MEFLFTFPVHVRKNKTTKGMWNAQNELTKRNSMVMNIIVEFYDFKQNDEESLDQLYEMYCLIICKLDKYEVVRSQHEININLIQPLCYK